MLPLFCAPKIGLATTEAANQRVLGASAVEVLDQLDGRQQLPLLPHHQPTTRQQRGGPRTAGGYDPGSGADEEG